jgi:hypothetical protein
MSTESIQIGVSLVCIALVAALLGTNLLHFVNRWPEIKALPAKDLISTFNSAFTALGMLMTAIGVGVAGKQYYEDKVEPRLIFQNEGVLENGKDYWILWNYGAGVAKDVRVVESGDGENCRGSVNGAKLGVIPPGSGVRLYWMNGPICIAAEYRDRRDSVIRVVSKGNTTAKVEGEGLFSEAKDLFDSYQLDAQFRLPSHKPKKDEFPAPLTKRA